VFERLLTFGDGPTDAVMVNNHDWLGKLGYIELLQEVGTHFTINRMLTFDSVKLRLEREQPMTFLEFNYMILQGYDFRHLSQAPWACACRWADRTSGATSSTASNSPAAWTGANCSASPRRC
jgi:tyrosyl-tRNA synthetase